MHSAPLWTEDRKAGNGAYPVRIRSISRVNIGTPLALPLGDVDERSEDGEGKWGCNTLSVTCGDSSPKGRAKGMR